METLVGTPFSSTIQAEWAFNGLTNSVDYIEPTCRFQSDASFSEGNPIRLQNASQKCNHVFGVPSNRGVNRNKQYRHKISGPMRPTRGGTGQRASSPRPALLSGQHEGY